MKHFSFYVFKEAGRLSGWACRSPAGLSAMKIYKKPFDRLRVTTLKI